MYLRTFLPSVLRPAGVRIGDMVSSHALVRYLVRHVTVSVLFLRLTSSTEEFLNGNLPTPRMFFVWIRDSFNIIVLTRVCTYPLTRGTRNFGGSRLSWNGYARAMVLHAHGRNWPARTPKILEHSFRSHARTLHRFVMSRFFSDVIVFLDVLAR